MYIYKPKYIDHHQGKTDNNQTITELAGRATKRQTVQQKMKCQHSLPFR